jgi:hypothetical protein
MFRAHIPKLICIMFHSVKESSEVGGKTWRSSFVTGSGTGRLVYV